MSLHNVLKQQARIRWMIFGGILSIVISVPLFFLGGTFAAFSYLASNKTNMAGVLLSVLLFLGGIVSLAIGLFQGVRYRDGVSNKGQMGVVPGVYIIGRYILNTEKEVIAECDLLDDLEYHYMVRVALPDGRRLEMKTARVVYDQIPEGGVGTIWHRGTWIGRFEFTPTQERPHHSFRM